MDVKFGHVLELGWALLSASRTAERAATAAAAAAAAAAMQRDAAAAHAAGGENAENASEIDEGDDGIATEDVVSGFIPPSLPLSRLKSAYEYAWTFGLRDGGVVPGAGGLWSGVKNVDVEDAGDDVSSSSSFSTTSAPSSSEAAEDSDVDKDKGEWWGEFEGMVAALHEWELTGNRASRDRFTRQLSIIYGYFADWSGDGGGGVRAVITEEQRRAEEPGKGGPEDARRSARKDAFHTLRGVLEVKRVLAQGVTRVRLGA